MHASDTGELAFEDVRVPADTVLGEIGKGFYHISWELQGERLVAAAGCHASCERMIERTLEYAKEREAFGRPIGKFQAIRHKFAEMATKAEAAKQFTYATAWRFANGEYPVREITMAKLFASRAACEVADECVQILGGYGYMKEYEIERAYRDVRLNRIGAGHRRDHARRDRQVVWLVGNGFGSWPSSCGRYSARNRSSASLPLVADDEERAMREAVRGDLQRFGPEYTRRKTEEGEPPRELWEALAEKGYLGVNLPERYGGGGLGMHALQAVGEEISAAGCALLLIVVSPAIVGSILARHGTEAQKEEWLTGIAAGTTRVAFAITEPDAGSNSHNISTAAARAATAPTSCAAPRPSSRASRTRRRSWWSPASARRTARWACRCCCWSTPTRQGSSASTSRPRCARPRSSGSSSSTTSRCRPSGWSASPRRSG